ncbi:MAG TPA: prolyl oligopeptidase family serine peptidase [Candidatus Binatia bacterium]|nr:prolyl oligopeptidase family serine peptidase [Candidatus Binatia bacterium]
MARSPDPASLIRAQVVLDEHDMSADGRFAVVVRRHVVADRYRSHLWLVPLAARGRAIQLTHGPVRDTGPRLAPDGSAVAFKRTAAPAPGRRRRGTREDSKDDVARLRILPLTADGRPAGAPWTVRAPKHRSIGEVTWSPDASRLALTIEVDPPRILVGPEPKGDDAPTARRITRIDWQWDEEGHLDRWSHLHVVEARRGATPRQVTSGDWGVSHIAWSPDGRTVAFTSDQRPDADLQPKGSIWTVDVDADGAAPREVLATGGHAEKPAWSPDGRYLAAIAYLPEDPLDDAMPELVVAPSDGSAKPWPLAPDLDRPLGTWNDTDMHGWMASSRTTPAWVDDSTIVAVVTDRGRATPWRYPVDSSTGRPTSGPRSLAPDGIDVYSLAATTNPEVPRDRRVTVVACVGSGPMELHTVPLDGTVGTTATAGSTGSTPRRRTTIGARWADAFEWPEMRELEAPGPGGPIHTWIASPPGAGDRPLPTVVDIHGGPLGAWAPAPHVEVVLLCARGYRVVLPNIRGSTSFGADWIRPLLGRWGGPDAEDVHAALNHVVGLGLADADRLGALGLSYGGFLVNWLVGATDRFKAAVSVNGVSNQVSAWAEGDSGVEFNRAALLGAPLDPEGVEKLWRQSPLANVASVRTPLLLLQGEADRRCPWTDNVQLFVALRALRRTVEFVLYPEESHVYFASGRPDRRIDHMTRLLDWFDRYLKA